MLKYCLAVLVCALIEVNAKYPADLPRCKAGDTVCLPQVITQVLRIAKDGRPDMNLPPIEPLRISKIDIEQGDTSPVQVALNFRDQELYGLSEATVTKVVGFGKDPKTSKFELDLKVPRISMVGKYKIGGKVLILPIQGKGNSNFTIDNVNINIKFKPKVTERDGQNFIQTEKFKLTFETSRLFLRLENLFNGDKALGENMNIFLNENWKDILQEMKPAVTNAFSQIFASIINGIFSRLSYDDIFEPES